MANKTYLAPKLPLEIGENGTFTSIEDSLVNARQKIKTILLTSPGEKIYNPEFGVGIFNYVFEPTVGIIKKSNNSSVTPLEDRILSADSFNETIFNGLKSQLVRYSDDITLENLEISVSENIMRIFIEYNYKDLISDTITMDIGT